MNTLAESCADSIAFSYRSIDRLILNAYIPTLQTPGAMAKFFRDVQHKPILAGKVFKDLTDRFVSHVKDFAERQGIPVHRVTDRRRPGEVAQAALKSAERQNRFGVVVPARRDIGRRPCSAADHLRWVQRGPRGAHRPSLAGDGSRSADAGRTRRRVSDSSVHLSGGVQ